MDPAAWFDAYKETLSDRDRAMLDLMLEMRAGNITKAEALRSMKDKNGKPMTRDAWDGKARRLRLKLGQK